jgi:hypothetical protein
MRLDASRFEHPGGYLGASHVLGGRSMSIRRSMREGDGLKIGVTEGELLEIVNALRNQADGWSRSEVLATQAPKLAALADRLLLASGFASELGCSRWYEV